MTANQMIKKIAKAGISTANIEITGRNEIEVKSETKAMKIYRLLPETGGFRTGYGSWVIRSGYQSNPLVSANID
jgi:hypothetical protein